MGPSYAAPRLVLAFAVAIGYAASESAPDRRLLLTGVALAGLLPAEIPV